MAFLFCRTVYVVSSHTPNVRCPVSIIGTFTSYKKAFNKAILEASNRGLKKHSSFSDIWENSNGEQVKIHEDYLE